MLPERLPDDSVSETPGPGLVPAILLDDERTSRYAFQNVSAILEIFAGPRPCPEAFEKQMREEKSQIECRIAIVADFEVDQQHVARPDEQVFRAEITVDEAATMRPDGFDQPF